MSGPRFHRGHCSGVSFGPEARDGIAGPQFVPGEKIGVGLEAPPDRRQMNHRRYAGAASARWRGPPRGNPGGAGTQEVPYRCGAACRARVERRKARHVAGPFVHVTSQQSVVQWLGPTAGLSPSIADPTIAPMMPPRAKPMSEAVPQDPSPIPQSRPMSMYPPRAPIPAPIQVPFPAPVVARTVSEVGARDAGERAQTTLAGWGAGRGWFWGAAARRVPKAMRRRICGMYTLEGLLQIVALGTPVQHRLTPSLDPRSDPVYL